MLSHRLEWAKQFQSPNQGGLLKQHKYIVVHYTTGHNLDNTTGWLCSKESKASAHVVVGREGRVNQLVPFDKIAWHVGASGWKGLSGINKYSIGIELDNEGPLVKGPDHLFRSPTGGSVVPAEHVLENAQHKSGVCSWMSWTKYPSAQIDALVKVCLELKAEYPSLEDCIGHDDVSPGRKFDPGPAFDISALRSRVFGLGV